MHLKERAAWGYGPQPAETLLEGEEIAEIIAAAHGLPVVRLTPGESAREQKIDAIYVVERRTVSR
jgi:hypothetical protein